MTSPLVSVIIPCYNYGAYLPEALASVAGQAYRDCEVLVVNDGSTEVGTLEVLREYERRGGRVLHTENRGPAAARNHGIRHAGGKYVLPLDADDRIVPGFLEQGVAVMESDPNVGIVYGLVELFGEQTGLWELPDYAPERLLYDNMIVATALFRRKDWMEVGGYDPRMVHGWEDWDFWLSLVEHGRSVVRLPQVTFHYRVRSASRTGGMTFAQKLTMFLRLVAGHWRLYLRHWPALFRKLAHPAAAAPRLR